MNEQWKPIPGYSNYEASSHGRIRNTKSGKIITGCLAKGYVRTNIRADHQRYGRNIGLHRLVAMAFHGLPPKDKPFCCHKDDISHNNVPSNLYWGDAKDNFRDAAANGKSKPFPIVTHL